MGDILVFLFLGFVFFVILFLKGKIKQKEMEVLSEKKEEEPPSSFHPPMHKKAHTHFSRTPASPYEVEEKEKSSFLSKGWNKKSSIKQAFILSEILKRRDDL